VDLGRALAGRAQEPVVSLDRRAALAAPGRAPMNGGLPPGQFHLQVLHRMSALIGDLGGAPPCRSYVTSTHYAAIFDELQANAPGPLVRTDYGLIGNNLIVINSGTEDQEIVNIMNREEAARVDFAGRRERLRSG
jgi:hypothetical protein